MTEYYAWKANEFLEAWNRQHPLADPTGIDHADESRPE